MVDVSLETIGDADLVAMAQAGDRLALEALLRRHHDRVYGVARRMLGDEAGALLVTRNALHTVATGLDALDGRSVSTWVYRAATRACLEQLRTTDAPAPRPGAEPPGVGADGTPMADPHHDDPAARLDLDHALGLLPADHRTALVLRDVAGLDYAQIALILEVAPGTVRSRVARARSALVEILGGTRLPSQRRRLDEGP